MLKKILQSVCGSKKFGVKRLEPKSTTLAQPVKIKKSIYDLVWNEWKLAGICAAGLIVKWAQVCR